MSNSIINERQTYITISMFIGNVRDFESRMKCSSPTEKEYHFNKCFGECGQHLYRTFVNSKNPLEFLNGLDKQNLMQFMSFDW
ncbi:hypothetical protein [Flammeovirga sp. SJP92]|uniref:hypothetical protein n=1 Tax=Flammeovirga sp. SJP92 TaxID=1775430 RepID=UPI0012F8F002|nr:hypothetical protein [Flammeovirga sp. SJP92]